MMKSRFPVVARMSSAIAVTAVVAVIAAAASGPLFSFRRPAIAPVQAGSVTASPTREAVRGEPAFGSYDIGGVASRPPVVPKAGQPGAHGTFIVGFREPALAAYRGGVPGIAMPKRRAAPGGRQRLDSTGLEARRYVSYLRDRQRQLERRIATANRASLPVRARMQHALNGIVVDMTNAQAARVARMPEVQFVEPYGIATPDTDVGPTHIGAAAIWNGTNPGAPAAYRGEGMVLGVIDTGINFGSPSFAAVDPVDGYVHVNPLGAGNYLGTCAAGGPDAGRCNAKLIGGYDMICAPPTSLCGQPETDEQPGFGDDSGHGSHTASTAAGNRRNLLYGGHVRQISGVAPRANVIAFDVCYYNTSTFFFGCPNTATTAAFDQAVADGMIDVINYSISGGTSPWTDPVSLAMLNAVEAGIYVSASAGNNGPTPGAIGHVQPWTGSSASAKHGRDQFLFRFGIGGPGAVPPPLVTILGGEASDGVGFTTSFPPTTPIRASARFNASDDGCIPYTPNAFAGAIVLIRRGTCDFAVKINHAAAAGAVAVVLANSAGGAFSPYAPGGLRPAIGIGAEDGTAVWNFIRANLSPTARIDVPSLIQSNTADALSATSSRGPVAGLDLLKPDFASPGVRILAASAGETITGHEAAVDMFSGTSMASPHAAGAALLMRQANPGWTPIEVKSALMITATDQVYLEDDITPANPHARGAGRVRVDRAINAGLVLDETRANFLAANPASGGQPAMLNLASLADATCASSCSFTRTFRNARTYGSLWRVQVAGLTGTAPGLLWVPAGGSASLTVMIDTGALPANGTWSFGKLVLTELFSGAQVNARSELQLPIGVVVPAAGASVRFVPGILKLPEPGAPSAIAGHRSLL